jgi:hypothetical protein
MLTPAFIPNGTTAEVLDALYVMGTSTTYADGSARAPGTFTNPGTASLPASTGTGSAWTWNYDNTTFATGQKTALYGYPPAAGAALGQVVALGATTSVTGAVWKQMLADTRTVNNLYVGLAKNAGTYTSWNNATTPFTTGDFTGFGYLGTGTAGFNYLIMWECEEAIAIQPLALALGNGFVGMAGAFVDPLSTNTANAETDGRLYGVATTGGSNAMGTTWLSSVTTTTAPLFVGAATATDNHSVTFTPGAGTLVTTTRFGTFTPSTVFTGRNGDLPQIPMQMWNNTQYIGQLRQIFITRDSITGNAWNVGATPKGYLLSASPSTACDTVLLAY